MRADRASEAGSVFLAVVLLAAVAAAQPAGALSEAGQIALRQLDAFRHDDFDAAYAFASSDIRQMFDRGEIGRAHV